MIEEILPASVAAVEAFGDLPDAELFPAEDADIGPAIHTRRREFATGRACARAALARLGEPPVAILRGDRGSPAWPPGIVGSITHCAGYRAAAVGRAADLLAIGLDAEPDQPLPDGVLNVVSLAAERDRLRDLARAAPGPSWDRMLFCAKETVYKAWFPLTGRWLGFHDADITIDAAGGTFDVRLLAAAADDPGFPLAGLAGRWLAEGGLVLTAVTVPAV